MIAVTQERDNIYTVQIELPELSWLTEISKGLGMERCTMLAACVTKGLEHYYSMITEIAAHEKRKREGG